MDASVMLLDAFGNVVERFSLELVATHDALDAPYALQPAESRQLRESVADFIVNACQDGIAASVVVMGRDRD